MSDMATQTASNIPQWSLGDRLRKAREDAGIKQDEMARRLAKSRGAVSGWESDLHRPDVLAIRAWAHESGVPVWWLLGQEPTDRAASAGYPGQMSLTFFDCAA